jgi:hypothetical protein
MMPQIQGVASGRMAVLRTIWSVLVRIGRSAQCGTAGKDAAHKPDLVRKSSKVRRAAFFE